jgi:cytochrome c oxidase assembly protein subunit 15
MATLVVWIRSERGWPANVRRWMRLAALATVAQFTLGLTTLLLAAPVGIAVVHQLGAVALLTVLLLAGVEATNARSGNR